MTKRTCRMGMLIDLVLHHHGVRRARLELMRGRRRGQLLRHAILVKVALHYGKEATV